MSRIDIIIPTYNRADYLKMAIDSVLNQTYKNYTLYVIDNCSTDNTAKLMETYTSSQLTYIKNKTNLGFIGNLNKALQTGSSDLFQIFHDDDILEPDFLDCAVTFFDKFNDTAFVHTGAYIINEKNELVKRHIKDYPSSISGDEFFENHLKNPTSIICPSVVFNRLKISDKILFNNNTQFTADVVFFILCSNYGNVGYINKPIIKYRQHYGSLTSTLYNNYELRLKDRFYHKQFLENQLINRTIDNKNNYANNYYRRALSADIWFIRMQGTSIFKILKLLPKSIKTLPSLLLYPFFWFALGKIFIPLALINYYRKNNNNGTS
jgi:glycosyltransferase involved in cell wall biosynthesis